jgi:hypothetical protein
MRKIALVVALVVVALMVAVAIVPAFGQGGSLFRSRLVGAPGANRPMRTVQSGGVPWTIKEASRTRLSESGRLRAIVRGLLITGTGNPSLDGTTGTVEQVVASLTCENPMTGSNGAPTIVSTSPATLSSEGNARIHERIALPDTCLGPIVLIRANSATGPWIAASGF